MQTDLTCVLPASRRGSLGSWLAGVKRVDRLNPEARLLPLLADLPPPAARKLYRVKPLDTAALRSFELRAVASAPAVAESATPVSLKQRIWELSHVVHEAHTNKWPHNWERPTFAHDEKHPTPAEYEPWALKMLKQPKGKDILGQWQGAPETAPRTRQALTELIEKLGELMGNVREEQEKRRQQQLAQKAVQVAHADASHAENARVLEIRLAHQQHDTRQLKLDAELEELQDPKKNRKKDQMAIMQKRMEVSQVMADRTQVMAELAQKHGQPFAGPYREASAEAADAWAPDGGAVLSQLKAERNNEDPGQPDLQAAAEYMRYFLPKTEDGKLLPLGCSEAEFAQHMGPGAAIYMHFVKMTMWMFVIASVIALPQLIANAAGTNLELSWPLDDADCPDSGSGVLGFVARVVRTVNYCIYASLLVNATSYGFPHLVSELLLSMMFCVYVYLCWYVNHQVLGSMEEGSRTRASDFAVLVARLPKYGSDMPSLRQHFGFFGEVASVCVSTENHKLLGLLSRHQALKTKWRDLHLDYGRELRAMRAEAPSPSAAPPSGESSAKSSASQAALDLLLPQIEHTWGELLRAREDVTVASRAPAGCTGHAVIIFRERSAASRCVRHFELIRRHERSRDGGSLGALDFRRLYFRTTHKLDVSRAPEPSDILWGNLRASKLQVARQNVKTTTIILLISCVSTVLITATSISATMDNHGLLTTLWSTPVIILSNVVIFISVPQLSLSMERHHTLSSQHMHMLVKMVFFQLFNTVVACLSFMFRKWDSPTHTPTCPLLSPPQPPKGLCFDPSNNGWVYLDFDDACVRHWYTTGAVVLINAVIGDLTAILGLIEFLRPDKLIIRYLVAPRARTQAEMNEIYALDSELYVPFRYQLVLKMVCIAFTFCSAIPALLPIAALFMYFSYKIDRYNFLRVFKPPPRTTDRTVTYSANQPVPLVYYACLCVLMALVMHRISAEIRQQSQRAIKEDDDARQRDDEHDDEGDFGEEAGAAAGHAKPTLILENYLDAIELYVPPLSSALLKAAWEKARGTAASRPDQPRVTSSTRSTPTRVAGSSARRTQV